MAGRRRIRHHFFGRVSVAAGLAVLFGAGLVVPSFLGGGAPSALGALTLTQSLCGRTFNCGSVTVEPELTVPFNGAGSYSTSPPGIACTVSPLAVPDGVQTATTSGTCLARFTWPVTQSTLTVTITVAPTLGSYRCCSTINTDPLSGTAALINGGNIDPGGGFKLIPEVLAISTSGVGTGKVTVKPAGTVCSAACTSSGDYGTNVTLTAAPDAGASFLQWTGACNGQGAVCTLQPKAALSTNAVFGLAGQSTSTATTTTTAKTTTTTPTTTAQATTAQTTTPATTTTGPSRPQAQLITVATARSKLGAREVEAELETTRLTTVTLSLTRAGKVLARRTAQGVRAGDRVVILVVPRTVTMGRAVLHITVSAGGASKSLSAGVGVPHA